MVLRALLRYSRARLLHALKGLGQGLGSWTNRFCIRLSATPAVSSCSCCWDFTNRQDHGWDRSGRITAVLPQTRTTSHWTDADTSRSVHMHTSSLSPFFLSTRTMEHQARRRPAPLTRSLLSRIRAAARTPPTPRKPAMFRLRRRMWSKDSLDQIENDTINANVKPAVHPSPPRPSAGPVNSAPLLSDRGAVSAPAALPLALLQPSSTAPFSPRRNVVEDCRSSRHLLSAATPQTLPQVNSKCKKLSLSVSLRILSGTQKRTLRCPPTPSNIAVINRRLSKLSVE